MLQLLFTLEGLLDLTFGVALLLVPIQLLSIYGMSIDRDGTFLARFLGATLIGFGALCWYARPWQDSDQRRLLVRALFGTSGLGFLVCVSYQLQPGAPWQSIVFVVLTLAFTVAWGWFALFRQAG